MATGVAKKNSSIVFGMRHSQMALGFDTFSEFHKDRAHGKNN
jgi:hypothetical protein